MLASPDRTCRGSPCIPFRPVLLSTLLLALASAQSHAQSYPTKTIKLVVPFGPGGPTDVAARVVAQVVQSGLGQNVVIENRPGAGGATGTKSVAAAEPDGYTMLIGTSATLGVVPALVKNPGYDPVKSFAPVAKISDSTTSSSCRRTFRPNSVARAGRLCQGQSGQAQLRLRRPRQPDPARRRIAAGPRRHQGRARALQERRRDGHRGAERAGADDISGHLDPAGADPGEEDQGARRHQRRAPSAIAGRADHGRERHRRLRHDVLDRRDRAGRHAAGHRRQAQRRDQRRLEIADWCTTVSRKVGAQPAPGSPQDFGKLHRR